MFRLRVPRCRWDHFDFNYTNRPGLSGNRPLPFAAENIFSKAAKKRVFVT
jgi:hypothetical protein